MRPRRVGVVTAGGDCPGMNAVLRAVVKAAAHEHGIEVVGFRDGFAGLLSDDALPLGFDDVSGILVQGGTILGASNKDDPFRVPTADGSSYVDRSDALLATLSRHGIDGLIVIGGDGSLRIADRLGAKGVAVVACRRPSTTTSPGRISPSASTRRGRSPRRPSIASTRRRRRITG